MSSRIKYPFGTLKENNKIVHIKDVDNGKDCNCYCRFCGNDLIAYKKEKKQRAHFRHKPNIYDCTGDYETFIHWITKEVFKEIDIIKLPPIDIFPNIADDIHLSEKIKELYSKFNLHTSNPILDFRLQDSTDLKFDNIEIEKRFSTKTSFVIIDVVLKVKDNDFFIEPFYSNSINEEKESKLISLNKSVLSIDLLSFARRKDYIFNWQELKNFIQNDIKSKKWEVLRKEKIKQLTHNYLVKVKRHLEKKKDSINKYSVLNKNIDKKRSMIRNLILQESKLKREIDEMIARTNELEKEIGFKNHRFDY